MSRFKEQRRIEVAIEQRKVLRSFSVGELGESDFHSASYSRFWRSESVDQRK